MPDPLFFSTVGTSTLTEPPLVHATHQWDPITNTLAYEYNGRSIISITVPHGVEFGYRHGSDGDMQSVPFLQQLYFTLENPATAVVTFWLSEQAICMRPHRAASEQAIIGQLGTPLLYGVNGLYDIAQDLLIEWHGRPWRWRGDALMRGADGDLRCELEVDLAPSAWFMNIKPHFYRMHLGYSYHEPWRFRPNQKAVSGWCSWEAYRRDVTEAHVMEAAEFFSEHLKSYGMEYIQIDDGFEKTPIPADAHDVIASTWLSTNSQFPNGHAGAIEAISAQGMQPGIWTSASLTNEAFGVTQPEVIISEKDGHPIQGDWLGFVLDCLPETLHKHVLPYYQGLRDMGYQYFKTDQIRHLLYDGLHKAVRLGLLTNAEAEQRFRAFLACAREGIGDDAYFLASWGVLSQAVGIVDACRISMDANPTWAGIRMQMVESARWFHAQRILFINDPDHICARAKLEWTRSVSSLCSLNGSLFMLSDPLEQYDSDRLHLLQRCLPPLPTVTGETGPLNLDYPAFAWTKLHGFAVKREKPVAAEEISLDDALHMAGEYPTMHDAHPFSSLWTFHLGASGQRWHIVGRFATVPLPAASMALDNLGVDPAGTYHVFDFWAQEYRGAVTDALLVTALSLGQCQILALRPALTHPQFLASSRHVSMDAVSVLNESWRHDTLILSLAGVPGTTETYWFFVPEEYHLIAATAEGLTPIVTQHGRVVAVATTFNTNAGELRLHCQR